MSLLYIAWVKSELPCSEHQKGWFCWDCIGIYWTPECLLNVLSVYTCSKYCRRDHSMSGNIACCGRKSLHVWNGGTTHTIVWSLHVCCGNDTKKGNSRHGVGRTRDLDGVVDFGGEIGRGIVGGADLVQAGRWENVNSGPFKYIFLNCRWLK